MSVELMATLLGGIGLFLLGMRLMTEGLKIAAGRALRDILARSTRTRWRGVFSGILVTALVQSSSAVTVATIGFVNAGLLTLAQALAVTYGSNIGTTMTGWLVASVGFHVNVGALALPLIGIGMALRLAVGEGRLGPLGEALAGFGVFFLGIDVLRTGFEGLSDQIQLAALVGGGPLRMLLFVVIGFGLTVVMQSSSAAIAVVLTATGGGVVPLEVGAVLVVGANVGTTTTAVLAVIGATPNAKRIAAAHIVFNVVTGVAALVLLPFLVLGIVSGRELLRLDAEPAAVLAAFHTMFNLLGVALLWPVTPRLLHSLEGRFRTEEEDEANPRYLDRHVLATPRLALDAMLMELTRVGQIARRIAGAALGDDKQSRQRIATGRKALAALAEEVGDFTQMLQRSRIPPELDELLPTTLRVIRHYAEVADLSEQIAAGRRETGDPGDPALRAEIAQLRGHASRLVERAGLDAAGYRPDALAEDLARFEQEYQQLKGSMLDAGARGVLSVQALVATLDWLSNVRRLAQQLERGTRILAELGGSEPMASSLAEEPAAAHQARPER